MNDTHTQKTQIIARVVICIAVVVSFTHADTTFHVGEGYDHATINSAITAIGTSLLGKGVVTILIHRKTGSAPWVYTENINVDSDNFSNVSSNDYTRLSVAAGDRHTGKAGTGVVLNGQLLWRTDHSQIEWLEIDYAGNGGESGVAFGGDSLVVEKLIIHGNTADDAAIKLESGKGTSFRNSIIYGNSSSGVVAEFCTLSVTNITVHNCGGTGLYSTANSRVDAVNCLVLDCGTDYNVNSQGTFGTCQHNYSSDATAPGNNTHRNISSTGMFMSTVSGSEDYHLAFDAPAFENAYSSVTDFSDDIDGNTRQDSRWSAGADQGSIINYRSIGADAGVLYSTGNVQIPENQDTIFFVDGASLPSTVGPGDLLRMYDGEGWDTVYIRKVVTTTTALAHHPYGGTGGTNSYQILRACNSLQAWEDARNGDLAPEQRREVGMCYNDGPFTTGIEFDNGTAGDSFFMHLTVAEGQHHNGTYDDGGVVIDLAAEGSAVTINDNYVRVEWLRITDWSAGGDDGVAIEGNSTVLNPLIQYIILHNNSGSGDAINAGGGTGTRTPTFRNCIIHNVGGDGISAVGSGTSMKIHNVTIDNIAGSGIHIRDGNTSEVRNTIVTNPGTGADIFCYKTHNSSNFSPSSNNISSDGSAPGTDSITNANTNDLFVDPGDHNYHLPATSVAIDAGVDLSAGPAGFDRDIDGDVRPQVSGWDIGADESIVNPPSNVAINPQGATIAVGGEVSFTATAGNGTPPYTFKFIKDNTDTVFIEQNVVQSTYTISNAVPSHSGTYNVYACNAAGCAASAEGALLTVLDTIVITQQPSPADTTVESGQGYPVTYTVTATGGGTIQYQWRKDGADIAGENSNSITLANPVFADSGAYSCRVNNQVDTVVSTSARLHVAPAVDPPSISMQPSNATVTEFQSVSFSAGVTGTAPFTRQWYHNGAAIDTTIHPTANDSIYTINIVSLGDSGNYTVKVCDSTKGCDSSQAALLTVNYQQPVINLQPRDTTIAENGIATFTISAAGSKPMSYAWIDIQEYNDTVSTTNTLTLNNLPARYDGATYVCIVANPGGSVVSDTATLTVVPRARASFSISDSSGEGSLTVGFFDSSSGHIETWKWYFGDGDSMVYAVADTPKTVAHTYADTGIYIARLEVVGNALSGRDTAYSPEILVYVKGDNPVKIINPRYVSSTQVELTFSGHHEVPRGPIPPLAAQIGLWYSVNGRAGIDTAQSAVAAVYDLSSIDADSVVTLAVTPPEGPGDTAYGFWVTPLWQAGPSLYNPFNTASIKMKPVNNLSVNGHYSGNSGDTATVSLVMDSLDKAAIDITLNQPPVDTAGIADIVIEYGFSRGSVRNSYSIPASTFQAGVAGDRYLHVITDPDFYSPTAGSQIRQVYVSVFQTGTNGLLSDTATAEFTAGWDPPVNTSTLVLDSVQPTRIFIHWDPVVDVDSIRILYTPSPDSVPLGPLYNTGSYGVAGADSLTQTKMALTGLSELTSYTIGMQVQKDLLWSDITATSWIAATTDSVPSGSSIPNTARIDSAVFNAETNLIGVYYTVGLQPDFELDLGMTWSLDSSIARDSTPDQNTAGMIRTIGQSTGTITDSFMLDLQDSLQFDTTYHVGLWLRSAVGEWSEPTDSSYIQVDIHTYTWQSITYFTGDSIQIFNGKIVFFKDTAYDLTSLLTDTVLYYAPTGIVTDYTPVSVGFSLKTELDAFQPFYVGIQYDSIPQGYTWEDLGMFRDSAGVWLVEHGFTVDTAQRMVYVYTSDFVDDSGNAMPFIVMVDKIAPTVTFLNDTAAALDPADTLLESFIISDNAANVKWALKWSTDNTGYLQQNRKNGVAAGSSQQPIVTVVPSNSITEENGVRILMDISDGVHQFTINVSRKAVRTNSDMLTTQVMDWVPVFSTANLNDPTASGALRNLAGPGKQWVYNKTQFRLFRWLPYAGNENTDNKWVEYAPEVDSFFRFVPGRLFWLKTRNLVQLGLGPGESVTQKDTFEIKLPPKEWTDFALPFRYPVKAGDIALSTGDVSDSLEFYEWDKVEVRDFGATRVQLYKSEGLYIPVIPGLEDPAALLASGALSGHTVYNRANREVILRIPPTPEALSSYAEQLTKKSVSPGWSIRVAPNTDAGGRLSSVYCGYRKGEGAVTYHHRPPSFTKLSVGVYDTLTARIYGHSILHRANDGVFAYRLVFCNTSELRENISYSLGSAGVLPEELVVKVLNPSTRQWEDPLDESYELRIEQQSREYRFLAVGTEASLEKFKNTVALLKLAFSGCFPNPFTNRVTVRYSVPYSGVGKVSFAVYTMKGQKIWKQKVRDFHPGTNSIVWYPGAGLPMAAGMYILRMKAYDTSGAIIGNYKTRLTYLR
ncbi:MAG: hypothetical protein GF350_15380 [Chitinivibrionales bacterium]|nr:hypothetical protein [Chitinivibrionales bacterium]